ncbi:hypothetical protein TruAng_002933 [Truncatella angustata]|nr:hypothetical protein TruAng_002933 [Truncatella angustata]
MITRGAYQSTGLALLLLAAIWLYTTIDFGFGRTGDALESDARIGSDTQAPVVVTQVVDVVPVTTPEPSKVDKHHQGAKPTQPSGSGSLNKPAGSQHPEASIQADRPLITYAYSESASARDNLKYFISQGLHGAADFIFILNGETDAATLIPEKSNIQIISRPNQCFDLGAHGEVLRKDSLWKKYKRFIALNASIRGPFIPYWARSCWSDVFLGRVTDEVKIPDVQLVGMTANCLPQYHVQSMIWATDAVGLELLLYPPPGSSTPDKYGGATDMVAMEGCYKDMHKAIHGEIGATGLIQKAGYKVDAMMAAFHKSKNYQEDCEKEPREDILWNGQSYDGGAADGVAFEWDF